MLARPSSSYLELGQVHLDRLVVDTHALDGVGFGAAGRRGLVALAQVGKLLGRQKQGADGVEAVQAVPPQPGGEEAVLGGRKLVSLARDGALAPRARHLPRAWPRVPRGAGGAGGNPHPATGRRRIYR